jgi:hypothetical protein
MYLQSAFTNSKPIVKKRRNPPKFLLSFLSVNQIMWRSFLSSLSLLKKRVRRRRRRRRGGVKGGNGIFP